MYFQQIKKTLATLLVMLMAFGLPAASVGAAGKGAFSDVETTHWAFKDIMKMSARQIIMGDGTGKFLPNDSVSQEQALAMALRAMGYKPEVDSYDTSSYSLDYSGVSSWAKGAVAIADKYNLLKSGESLRFNGNSPATREWIAQLLVRTIGKDAQASSYSSQASSFADKSQVSSWAADYVNLAASSTYSLIRGIPNSDGSVNFNPKGSVKRAEMAALLSRAEKYLPTPIDQVIGQVTAVNANQLTLQTNSGVQKVNVSSDTTVFINGALASTANISTGDAILSIGNPTALYVENVDASSVAQTVSGTLVKVYPSLHSVVLKDSTGMMKTYSFTDQTTYSDQDGSTITADQLVENDNIQLAIMSGKVVSITRLGSGNNTSNSGTVYEVDLNNNLLTVQNSSGVPQVYTLSANTTVTYPDLRATGLNGLNRGMKIKVSVTDGVVSSIQVDTIIEEGTVISLSADKSILTYSDKDGKPKVQTLTVSTTVTFKDDTIASLSDLKASDSILLKFDKTGVSNIKLTNRSLSNGTDTSGLFIEGTIAALDKDSKTLILKQTDGQLVSYRYDTIPQLFINGITSPTISNIKVDMQAKIQLDNNNYISYLNIDNRIQGTVYLVNADQRVISISLPTGIKSYTVDPSYTVTMYKRYTADLSDIHRNDIVRINADTNNVITNIEVQTTNTYKVTNVPESSKWIGVEDSSGNGYGLNLDATTLLKVPGIALPAVTDVKVDDMVKATYMGSELQEVDVMPTVTGTVTSVNTSTQGFTVQKTDGTSTTFSFTSGDVVKYDNTQTSALTALAVGDRVQVKPNFNGQNQIYKMTVVRDKVNTIDNIYIYLLNSMKGYRFAPNVYTHQGVYNIGISSLQQNDSVTLYIMNDTVYEINKAN